jgi:hypothetical protein
MLYQIIYYSTACKNVNEGELYTLAVEAQLSNEKNAVTGLLAYIEGVYKNCVTSRFMQVLEGSKEQVVATYQKIKTDQRHCNVRHLMERAIFNRSFGEWSMKLEKIDLNAHPSLIEFFNLEQHLSQHTVLNDCTAALDFLKKFQSGQ